jgi:hypothetical protein
MEPGAFGKIVLGTESGKWEGRRIRECGMRIAERGQKSEIDEQKSRAAYNES